MDLENRVKEALAHRAAPVRPGQDAWAHVERAIRRRKVASRVLAAGVGLAISTVSVWGLWLAFGPSHPDQATVQEPLASLSPSVPETIAVGPLPSDITVADGAVWVSVSSRDSSSHFVIRVDPAVNKVVAEIPVETPINELVAGGGAVWGIRHEPLDSDSTSYRGFLVRIDPNANRVVSTVPGINGPLAFGAGAVWATDEHGSLVRIDPSTSEVVATIPLGVRPWYISATDDAIWILPLEDQAGMNGLIKVDPATDSIDGFVEIRGEVSVFPPTVGQGFVWVPVVEANDAFVVRIDTRTDAVVGSPIPVPSTGAFAVWEGMLWLLGERGTLYALDTESLETDEVVGGFPWPVAASFDPSAGLDPSGSVWVANYSDTITRIDLS